MGQLEKDGERIGYKKINLADYIDKGFSTYTYKMDNKDEIYLTVKILVISSGKGGDIPNTALRAIQQRKVKPDPEKDGSDGESSDE